MASGTKIADMTVGLHFDGSKMYVDMKNISKQAEAAGTSSGKGFSGKWAVAMGAISGIASSVFSKVSSSISNSMDGAISRMDTLNNFPKVMTSLGYAADEAAGSVQSISDHLDGLPTTLDDMVSNTQQLAASMGNLNQGTVNATSVGLAFNDMMLAGGKGTDAANRAFTQYNQMLAKGKVDMQSWNSLVEAAPGQMNQLATSILGAGKNQKDLYEALQEGTVSFDDLNAAMVKLDKEGGDGFASFNEQAIAGTEGLKTSLENVQTSFTKIITAGLQGEDMSKPIDQFVTRLTDVAQKIIPAIGQIFVGVVKMLPTLLKEVGGVILQELPNLIRTLVDALPEIITSLVQFLTDPNNISLIIQAAVELFFGIVKAIPVLIVELVKAIPGIIGAIIGGIGDVLNGLLDLLPAPVADFLRTIGEGIMSVFGKIAEVIGGFVNFLVSTIGPVVGWLWDNVLSPIVSVIGSVFGTIFNIISGIINGIISFVGPIVEWVASNIVQPIADFLGGLFGWIGDAIGVVVEFVQGLVQKQVQVIQGVINTIRSIFQGIADFVGGVFKAIGDFIGGIFNTIGNIIKAPINGIIQAINGVLSFINGIKIPDWVPVIGGAHTDFGMIPLLAKGGVATGTTTAIIGEAGKEAVLPLERNTDNWSGLLASALAEEMRSREDTPSEEIHVVINNQINSELDARNISQVMEQAIRRASI